MIRGRNRLGRRLFAVILAAPLALSACVSDSPGKSTPPPSGQAILPSSPATTPTSTNSSPPDPLGSPKYLGVGTYTNTGITVTTKFEAGTLTQQLPTDPFNACSNVWSNTVAGQWVFIPLRFTIHLTSAIPTDLQLQPEVDTPGNSYPLFPDGTGVGFSYTELLGTDGNWICPQSENALWTAFVNPGSTVVVLGWAGIQAITNAHPSITPADTASWAVVNMARPFGSVTGSGSASGPSAAVCEQFGVPEWFLFSTPPVSIPSNNGTETCTAPDGS